MNSAVLQVALMLIMMQVSKRLDMEDPVTINYIRGAFIASNAVILGLYLYTKFKVEKQKDLTTIKYMEKGSPFSGDQGGLKTTTVYQYDLDQVNGAIKGVFQSLAMMAFMHLYMKYTNPLVMQSVMPLKSAIEQKVVQIHVFGKAATGDLKRPFKAASLFGGLTDALDAKSESAAEASGKGGIKAE